MSHRLLAFGDDARPISQIITRRHPMALGMYLVVFLLGMIFVTHWGYGPHTEKDLFPGVSPVTIWGWKILMTTGGGGAVLSLLTKPRPSPLWPDISDLLHLEGIAAIVAAFGLMVYLVVVVRVMGFTHSGPAITLYGVLIVAHFVRAKQTIKDAKRLKELANLAAQFREEVRRDDD